MLTNQLPLAQRTVLFELCYGDPNTKAIAHKLNVQAQTVSDYLTELMKIYGVKNRCQLIWAYHSHARSLFK
jgi:DNA-binding NarL/FixJ family response regulator